jgi:hypothetical protein
VFIHGAQRHDRNLRPALAAAIKTEVRLVVKRLQYVFRVGSD